MQLKVESVLADLVNQFSDPHAFFRELIQNAIDAGSGEVEVDFEYDSESEVMTATVRDWGEGMSREIIESKLTRLFSSAKDADFTKIGKFGIGFVSVFAIAPDAVCVDTGRDAEFWRVLFDEDRSYDLIRLEHPVEGTQIRVIKAMSEDEYQAFHRRAVEVISHWCRHVSVPIVVDGDEINEAFEIDALVQVTYEEEGTRVVAGLVPRPRAFYGFYNRGLTLKEGDESPWPHVTLKIDSRYLEHTLTRDQVLQDQHYHKAMELLSEIAGQALGEELVEGLEASARKGVLDHDRWLLLEGYMKTCETALDRARERRAIVPLLGGEVVSLAEVAKRHRKKTLYVAAQDSFLARKLAERASVVVCSASSALRRCLHAFIGERVAVASESWIATRPSDHAEQPGAAELLDELGALLGALGRKGPRPEYAHLDDPGSPARRQIALVSLRHGELAAATSAAKPTRMGTLSSDQLLLNADDARVVEFTRRARTEPEWAALALCKMILLSDGLRPSDDATLTGLAMQRRSRRQGRST